MDAIQKFIDIFEQKRMSSSWSEMTSILKECDQYFKNVPASERGLKNLSFFYEISILQDAVITKLVAALNSESLKT